MQDRMEPHRQTRLRKASAWYPLNNLAESRQSLPHNLPMSKLIIFWRRIKTFEKDMDYRTPTASPSRILAFFQFFKMSPIAIEGSAEVIFTFPMRVPSR